MKSKLKLKTLNGVIVFSKMYFFTTNDIADMANSNTIENFIFEVTVTKLLEL